MKNNKGYTLVELLVAVALLMIVMAEVGALMINSQNLYSHGFYEVNLQEESQLVIQQIEDLLMGAAVDVKYETLPHNGIDSDVLTIVTAEPKLSGTGVPTGDYDEVTYKIGLAFDVKRSDGTLPGGGVVRSDSDYGTDTHKFESLVMSKQVGSSPATFSTMAEGVRSLRVYVTEEDDSTKSLQNYKGNYVTIYLEMQNQQYSYKTDTSAHSIYLRNMPGSPVPKPTTSPASGGGNNDKVVNVLREHKFDLHDYVGDDYVEFKWKEVNGSTAKYTLGTTTGKLACVDSLNSNPNDEVPLGNCVILATKTAGDFTTSVEIQMYTEKVSVKNMPLYIYDNMTAAATSVFPVTGVCVCDSCVKKHNIIPVMVLTKLPASADAFKFDDAWGCGKEIDCKKTPTPTPAWFDEILWKGLGNNTDGDPITASNLTSSSMKTVAIPQSGILHYSTYSHTSGSLLADGGSLGANYTLVNNNVEYLNLGGGNATYTYGSLCTHDANCVVMHTQTHLSTNAGAYWDKVVDAADGFCGLRFRLEWEHCPAYEFYGYWYPQQSGSAAQHDKIMERIATVYTDSEGTEYNFTVTTPTAYPTPALGATGAAAGSNLESTGVSLISTTDGLITIKNTGTANSGNSWSFTADAGIELDSVTCGSTGFGMSCSGKVITITGYSDIAAGTEVDIPFTYVEKAPPANIENGGVTLTSGTAGTINIKNTGGSGSGSSWTLVVDTGVNLQSVSCSTSGYNLSIQDGTKIRINGYTDIAAGTEVDLAFTYTKAPEPLVIPAGGGGYTLSDKGGWTGTTTYKITFTNPTTEKVSSMTVTLHINTGTVSSVGGGVTGTVSGDTITVTCNNWGNGIAAGESVTVDLTLGGDGVDVN